jgi:hypothetical protein
MHGAPDDYAPRTKHEERFLAALMPTFPDGDVWPHEDARGPWLLISVDIVEGGWIRAVPRLDFDGGSIRGGYSPAALNWDNGVRAANAGVGPQSPGWISLDGSPEDLAAAAAAWFRDRVRLWRDELSVG